jgi:hypothetical protein
MSLGEYIGAGSGVTRLLLHLDSSPNDSSGNAQSPTATNVTYENDWLNNSGLFVRASNARIAYADAASLQLGTGDFTISVLHKPDTVAIDVDNQLTIFSKNFPNLELFLYQGKLSGYIGASGFNGSTSLTISTKYHFLVRRISGVVTSFVNGKQDYSGTLASSISGVGQTLNVGSRPGTAQNCNGNLDEVIFESRGWTDAEVRRYYSMVMGFTAIT